MIEFKVTDSGYPVIYYQRKDSSTITAQIVIGAGSSHEDKDSYGVAHFLEHMCFQGTADKDKHKVGREMALNGYFNAYTNYFETCYYFETLNENFNKCFELLKESVWDSIYPEKEFEKEKQVILEEWSMYDNYPNEHYKNFALDKYFGETCHPVIGYKESIENMNCENLHRFRNKWYGLPNTFVVVVGGKPFDEVFDTINSLLTTSTNTLKTFDCLDKKIANEQKYEFNTNRFKQTIYGLIQPWKNTDWSIANNYISNFFTGCLQQLMYEYIRDDLGICYGIKSGRICHRKNSYLTSYIMTSKSKLNLLQDAISKIYIDIKTIGFNEEIRNISKFSLSYSHLNLLENITSLAFTISSLYSFNQDEEWLMTTGQKVLDSNWLKQSIDFSNEDLIKFSNENIKDQVDFYMIAD